MENLICFLKVFVKDYIGLYTALVTDIRNKDFRYVIHFFPYWDT